MITCTQIEILDIPAWVPEKHLFEGRLFLDLPGEDFSITQSKSVGELSDINRITADQTLSFDLPMSTKNHLALSHLVNPNTFGRTRNGIRIRALQGVHVMKQDLLYVLSDFDGDEKYSVEIRYSEHWIQLSERTKLCELDLGTFEFGVSNVKAIQENNARYEDNDLGIFFPLVNYGSRFRMNRVVTEDFRPLHHALSILQKGFCSIGWKFRSPVLETDYGRRLITYVLGETLGGELEQDEFKAVLTADSVLPEQGRLSKTLVFDKVLRDPRGNYDNTTGIFSGSTYSKFIAELSYAIQPFDVQSCLFEIVHENAFGSVVIESKIVGVNLGQQTTGTVTLISAPVAVAPSDRVYVRISVQRRYNNIFIPPDLLYIFPGSTFYNQPVSRLYSEGDIVDLAKIINCSYSLLDYFKGIAHYFRAKIETDWTTRTVTMYSPDTVTVYGENAEGYYQNEVIDVSELIQPNSKKTITETFEFERYIRLQFKKSSDPTIADLKLPDDQPLYSKTIDLGKEFSDETKVFENPFFEPTLNKVLTGIGELAGGPSVPHMLDNPDGKLSFDIKPRILYADGTRLIYNDPQEYYAAFMYNDQYTGAIPLAYQRIRDFTPEVGDPLDKVVLYGNDTNDAYSLFWKNDIKALFNSVKLEMLAFLDLNFYSKLDFRKKLIFNYKGQLNNCRLVEIRDYNGCSDISTPMLLIPDEFETTACEINDDPPRDTECFEKSKDLVLNVIKFGDCYSVFLGGNTDLTIESVTIEWRYLNETTWTQASNLCNPERAFVFRIVVTFEEDCPDTVLTKVIDPCTGSQAFIQYDFNAMAGCLSVIVGGIDPAVIDTIVIEYELDGGQRQNYDGPICDFFLEACFFITVTFNNGCEPIELEGCFKFPIPPFPEQFCNHDAGVVCQIDEEQNIVIPFRTGYVNPAYVLLDLIKYRYHPDEEPRIWDEVSELGCPVEIQRVIIFCNNLCPPWCSEWIQCYCDCIPFNTGNPNDIAVCN